MKLLWFNAITQKANQQKVNIQIIAEGLSKDGKEWNYGVELNYGNPELAYCKPLDIEKDIPEDVYNVFHLPPLSGVQTQEKKLELGAQRHIIGEGRPGEILRNLLLQVQEKGRWEDLCWQIKETFRINLEPITFNAKTEENILVYYRPETWAKARGKKKKVPLEIANGGSGFLQFLLLAAFLYVHENSILLIDEPDSHMHVRLQQGMYDWLQKMASEKRVQLLISTHSEVIINSTDTDYICTFFGKVPKSIRGDKQQIIDALKKISAMDIINAQDKKFIFFAEGVNDLRILKTWASKSKHEVEKYLSEVFFESTGDDQIENAREKYKYLRVVEPSIKGFFIRDNVSKTVASQVPPGLEVWYWPRKEIENYLVIPALLERFVQKQEPIGGLFVKGRLKAAQQYLKDNLPPNVYKDPLIHDIDGKGSDFLEKFFKEIGIKISKGEFWQIADLMQMGEIHNDIKQVLDVLLEVIKSVSTDTTDK